MAQGWQREVLEVEGLPRVLLWKAPAGPWNKGAILVLHGGGGRHHHFCVANAPIIAPQIGFTRLALSQGFAVFLLDSSDKVTDNEGRSCGKVWDDERRDRPNLDLPFIERVIGELVPRLRPTGSRAEIFLTGLSSGGYMTARAATHLGSRIAAFAPVSSGDPYGWHRICERGMTRRTEVHGMAFDNETRRNVSEPGACRASAYPSEKPWDDGPGRPPFRVFHHEDDGVHDISCNEKIRAQLRARDYPEAPAFIVAGNGQRAFASHLWLDAYSSPILDLFSAYSGR